MDDVPCIYRENIPLFEAMREELKNYPNKLNNEDLKIIVERLHRYKTNASNQFSNYINSITFDSDSMNQVVQLLNMIELVENKCQETRKLLETIRTHFSIRKLIRKKCASLLEANKINGVIAIGVFCLRVIDRFKIEIFNNHECWFDVIDYIKYIREICETYDCCDLFRCRVSTEVEELHNLLNDSYNSRLENLLVELDHDEYLWLEKFHYTFYGSIEFMDHLLSKLENIASQICSMEQVHYSSNKQLLSIVEEFFNNIETFICLFEGLVNFHKNDHFHHQKCAQNSTYLAIIITQQLVQLFDHISPYAYENFDGIVFEQLVVNTLTFIKESTLLRECHQQKLRERLYQFVPKFSDELLKKNIDKLCDDFEKEKWSVVPPICPSPPSIKITSNDYFCKLFQSVYPNEKYDPINKNLSDWLDKYMPSQTIPPKYLDYFNHFSPLSSNFGNCAIIYTFELFSLYVIEYELKLNKVTELDLLLEQQDNENTINQTKNDSFNNVIQLVSAIYLLIYRQFERKNYKFPLYFQNVDFEKFHEKSKSKFQHIDTINNVKFKQTLASSSIPIIKNPLQFMFPISLLNSLMKLLLFIRFRLDSNSNVQILDEFFNLARDMHDFTCVAIAKTTIKFEKLLSEIIVTKFDLKSQVSTNSPYVDTIVYQIQSFNKYLSTFLSDFDLDNNDINDIWRYVTLFITNTIVEGYTSITKCTQAGRDLMQLDFQQLSISLDSIFPFKKMVTRGYVEDAIRCFYFPEDAFEEFINDPLTQSRYTPNQLKSLTKLIHGKSSKIKLKFGKIFM